MADLLKVRDCMYYVYVLSKKHLKTPKKLKNINLKITLTAVIFYMSVDINLFFCFQYMNIINQMNI